MPTLDLNTPQINAHTAPIESIALLAFLFSRTREPTHVSLIPRYGFTGEATHGGPSYPSPSQQHASIDVRCWLFYSLALATPDLAQLMGSLEIQLARRNLSRRKIRHLVHRQNSGDFYPAHSNRNVSKICAKIKITI